MLKFTTSFRRYYLDEKLMSVDFGGDILDIGGKKANKRGCFRPPVDATISWKYLNIDESTNPDILGSAEDIPADSNSFDMVLMCEVLEHLKNPYLVLREISRVLRSNGQLIASAPFLFPIHADPDDFQRWTSVKLEHELREAGFSRITITPMGGPIAVTFDLMSFSFKNKPFRLLLRLLRPLIFVLDRKLIREHSSTGYFIQAQAS